MVNTIRKANLISKMLMPYHNTRLLDPFSQPCTSLVYYDSSDPRPTTPTNINNLPEHNSKHRKPISNLLPHQRILDKY